MTLKSGLEVT